MVRAPDTREQLLTQLPAGFDPRQWATRIVNVPAMAISSTEIRRRLANGEPIDDMTPAPVAAYIRKWNLYRPRTP
jgi:nicotinic acid mononucleotide adenylyltransferase